MTVLVILSISAAIAIGIGIAMIILAVGHQSEERPGYLDLTGYTGLRPRAGYQWPSVSRPRAQAGHIPAVVDERVPHGLAALIGLDGLEAVFDLRDPSETELARRVATQQQPRGADAA